MLAWVLARRALPLSLLLVAAAPPLCAQSLQNVVLRSSFTLAGAGARGTGMGGAFVAVADDGTAASFNPAGLAQLRGTELSLVGFDHRIASDVERGGELFEHREEKAAHHVLDFAGLALPFDLGSRRLTVQLSYQRAVDLFGRGRASISYPAGTLVVPEVPGVIDLEAELDFQSEQEGALHVGSLAAGLEVAGPLSVGASLNFWFGSWRAAGREASRLELEGPALPETVVVEDSDLTFDQDHELQGLNVNLGLLLRGSRVSLGGILRLPFAGTYRAREAVDGRTFWLDPAGTPFSTRSDIRTTLRWPRSVGVGLAVRPLRGLTLAADYTRTLWSQAVVENVPNGALQTPPVTDELGEPVDFLYTDRNFFDLFPASETVTRDSGQWRGGAEYLLALRRVVIPFRAGLYEERSPVPDLASLRGRRIRGYTLGCGLAFDRLVLDLAFETRRSSGAVGAQMSEDLRRSLGVFATEDVTLDRVVASVILRTGGQGGDDPVGRFLRRVFGR